MSDYSAASRTLHRLAVGNRAVAEISFDLERAVFGRQIPDQDKAAHVFVTGLARSGTTILMRSLFETGNFCSLTYRDMPFVLAPGLWRMMSGGFQRKGAAGQRAHGDGILVDFDSPEALDEVFWRVMAGETYIHPDRLSPMVANPELIKDFRDYVGLIMRRYGATRYLSKNNNNILRIGTLVKAFPEAVLLVPYRDPLQQAFSLLRQHERFTEQQKADPFTRDYMTWLAHHEFGADHRPFEWAADVSVPVGSLDYWLLQWTGAYRHLLAQAQEFGANLAFVGYERLCEDDTLFVRILERLGLDPMTQPGFQLSRSEIDVPVDPDYREAAMAVYSELEAASL